MYVQNGMSFISHFQPSGDWAFFLYFLRYSNIYGINKVFTRMDRRPDRISITKNSRQKYRAARELLHFFKFEYNISNSDYKYALTTERLVELGEYRFVTRIFLLICYMISSPTDRRMRKRLISEVKRIIFFNK